MGLFGIPLWSFLFLCSCLASSCSHLPVALRLFVFVVHLLFINLWLSIPLWSFFFFVGLFVSLSRCFVSLYTHYVVVWQPFVDVLCLCRCSASPCSHLAVVLHPFVVVVHPLFISGCPASLYGHCCVFVVVMYLFVAVVHPFVVTLCFFVSVHSYFVSPCSYYVVIWQSFVDVLCLFIVVVHLLFIRLWLFCIPLWSFLFYCSCDVSLCSCFASPWHCLCFFQAVLCHLSPVVLSLFLVVWHILRGCLATLCRYLFVIYWDLLLRFGIFHITRDVISNTGWSCSKCTVSPALVSFGVLCIPKPTSLSFLLHLCQQVLV